MSQSFALTVWWCGPPFSLRYPVQLPDCLGLKRLVERLEAAYQMQEERIIYPHDLENTQQVMTLLYAVHWPDMINVPPELATKGIERTAKQLMRGNPQKHLGRNLYEHTQQMLWDNLADLENIRLGLGPTHSVSSRRCVPLYSEFDDYADTNHRRQLSIPELRTRD